MTQEEFKKRYRYDPDTDKLGEGGFGSVFKTYDTYRDRWVALKISKVNPAYESIRLKKEVEMVAQLPVHPNIAYYEDCYTFKSFDGEYDFGILQYYEQGNLSQLLKQNILSQGQKQGILEQILSGVEFLHSHGIIHRDLKPQNILIVKRGEEYIPKITDFGISKQLDVNKSSVFSNSIAGAGTLAYASPEQLGDRTIRKNADLWSFGVIAYQTLTGSLPFTVGGHAVTSEAGRVELFRQINSGQMPAAINSIAEPWQQLIRACLVPDPEKRVTNCQACVAILKGKMQDVARPETFTEDTIEETIIETPKRQPKPEAVPKPKPSSKPSQENRKSNPVVWILSGIAGGIAGLLLVLFLTGVLSTSNKENVPTGGGAADTTTDVVADNEQPDPNVSSVPKVPTTDVVADNEQKEKEAAAEKERLEREQKEKEAAAEKERLAREQKEKEAAAEKERLEREQKEKEAAAEKERLAREQKEKEAAAEKERLAREQKEKEAAAELVMVKVEGGTFTMGCTSEQGSDCLAREKPAHSVTLSSFSICKYEVTQAQWKAVMGTTVRQQRDKRDPSWGLAGEGDNYPMYYVSWDEAWEFIRRLNAATGKSYRLPTEAEWEYAARGGNRSQGYKYSGSNNIGEVAWYKDNSGSQNHPVGTKKANELGIHDMTGNVWEWCQDWHGDYSASSQQNPKGASSGSDRVNRGGSWGGNAGYCRVAYRGDDSPGRRGDYLGFRVVLP